MITNSFEERKILKDFSKQFCKNLAEGLVHQFIQSRKRVKEFGRNPEKS